MQQEKTENILIEINESGVVQVHAEIGDAPFLNLIAPAIENLDEAIRAVQAVVNSEAFQQAINNAASQLAEAPGIQAIQPA